MNCYILHLENRNDCLMIDPGDHADRIVDFLSAHHLIPALCLLTHGHIDHLSALPDVLKQFPAPVAMHALDHEWAFRPVNQLP
ncbi:MAG: MBL fold metallo-hydrolase, partial [Lentisphaerota bacterium]